MAENETELNLPADPFDSPRVDIRFSDGTPLTMSPAKCIICGTSPVHARSRCRTCYQYLYRTGVDRSWELITAAGQKALERR